MPTPDPWLSRQNEALKLRGLSVTLELCGSRLRLRASMPPRPKDGPGGPWKQQRLSTGLEYPARASEAVELAETLGRALERDRTGVEPFDWTPWDQLGGRRGGAKAGSLSRDAVAGGVALSMTRRWWEARGGRGRSSEDSWDGDDRQPLATLKDIEDLQPAHLPALVQACGQATRSRLRARRAAAAMAQTLGCSDELWLSCAKEPRWLSPTTYSA